MSVHLHLADNDVFDRAGLAKALGLGRVAIMRAISRGELTGFKVGGKTWFVGSAVRAWLTSKAIMPGRKVPSAQPATEPTRATAARNGPT